MTENDFALFDQYIKRGEPDQAEKCYAWKAAIGLQAVDGLYTSEYLRQTAAEHIEGTINMNTAKERIQQYYKVADKRKRIEADTKEADIVSIRITEILCENAFTFSPIELFRIHRKLFEGVFDHAGMARTYNITKKEWVLNGETIYYTSCNSISETLEYDFDREKRFSYKGISLTDTISHISDFVSGIWQIHPFCEGNTRTTAVFIILYLRKLGFNINNDIFAENSWYFRNALVRANYTNYQKGIFETKEYLNLFFENLLMNTKHELKNRFLHIELTEK